MWQVDYIESIESKWRKGADPMHYYHAMLLQMVSSLGGGKRGKITDFLIDFEQNTKQSTKSHQQIMYQVLGLKDG